jgi:hypothetical protein
MSGWCNCAYCMLEWKSVPIVKKEVIFDCFIIFCMSFCTSLCGVLTIFFCIFQQYTKALYVFLWQESKWITQEILVTQLASALAFRLSCLHFLDKMCGLFICTVMASDCSSAYSLVLQQAHRTLEIEVEQGANK